MAEMEDFKDVFEAISESILVQMNILDQMILSNENMLSVKDAIGNQTEYIIESAIINKETIEKQQLKGNVPSVDDEDNNNLENGSNVVQLNILDQMILSNEYMVSLKDSIDKQTEFIKESMKINKETLERQTRADELDSVSGESDKKTNKPKKEKKSDAFKFGETLGSNFLAPFRGMTASLGTIAASAAAVFAAMEGLRGWEGKIISSITKGVSSLSNIMKNGLVSLRNSILVKYFGFTAETADDVIGPRAMTISQQISERISDLRNSALRLFGMGPDGRITKMFSFGDDAGSILGKVTSGIKILLSPLKSVAQGISGFVTGVGKGIMEFVGPYVGKAGKFVSLFGKILKPLGILFSAFDGVTTFMSTEGSFLDKLGAGLGAALGDFVGAPLDLIKNSMAWVVGKLFGIESKDGTYDESTVTGRILNMVKEFSFDNLIDSLIQAPFKFVSGAWNWIKTLFTNPVEGLKQYWSGLFGEGGVLDILWTPVSLAIDWITKKFGWRDEDAPTFNLLAFIKEKWNSIVDKFKSFFDFLPSLDDIGDSLYSLLPSWLRPENLDEERERLEQELQDARNDKQSYDQAPQRIQDRRVDPQIRIDEIQERLSEIPQLKRGGIFNAAMSGSPVMLHGQEAVIPLDTSNGQRILSSAMQNSEDSISRIRSSAQESNETLEGRMRELNAVEETAIANRGQPVMLHYAPNISPSIQQSVQGGTVATQNSVFGGGSGSLNFGLPGAAQ